MPPTKGRKRQRTEKGKESGSIVSQLKEHFPGRHDQIGQIMRFLGTGSGTPLFLYGIDGTGKTSIMRDGILPRLPPNVKWAYFDAIESHQPKLLFESVIDQFVGFKKTAEGGFASYYHCPSLNDFISYAGVVLRGAKDEIDSESDSDDSQFDHAISVPIIVIDQAERLLPVSGGRAILSALLSASQLLRTLVSVVFISSVSWELFELETPTGPPLCIRFGAYNRSETIDILMKDVPISIEIEKDDEEEREAEDDIEDEKEKGKGPVSAELNVSKLFRQFLQLLYDVFKNACKDVNELRYMARLLFPIYKQPVVQGTLSVDDGVGLYRHIEPFFKEVLDKMYLRHMSTTEWEKVSSEAMAKKGKEKPRIGAQEWSWSTHGVELPYYSKYLLLCAYLASFIPQKHDLKLFARGMHGRSRTTSRSRPKAQSSTHPSALITGPKAFPVDRMLAIFKAIVFSGKPVSVSTTELHSQVASLTHLGLLVRVSTADNLDAPKYKLGVSKDVVSSIARSVRFDLTPYEEFY